MEIIPIKAFKDNLIWMLIVQDEIWVVDPGMAAPVTETLHKHKLKLTGIILTHHHHDHTGGVAELKDTYNCPSYGPENISDHTLSNNDTPTLAQTEWQVLAVPYHTLDHLAFYSNNILFCGDALFSVGCGRIFEGNAQGLLDAMNKFKKLPDATRVYAAHEYTIKNIEFAIEIWPEKEHKLLEYSAKCHEMLAKDMNTLPSTIKIERELNPFMNAEFFANKWGMSETEAISKLRSQKDAF